MAIGFTARAVEPSSDLVTDGIYEIVIAEDELGQPLLKPYVVVRKASYTPEQLQEKLAAMHELLRRCHIGKPETIAQVSSLAKKKSKKKVA